MSNLKKKKKYSSKKKKSKLVWVDFCFLKSLRYYFPGLHLQDQVSLSLPFVQTKSCSIYGHTNSIKNLWAKVTSDPVSFVSISNNLIIIRGSRLAKKHNRIETTFFFPFQHFLMALKGAASQTLIPVLLYQAMVGCSLCHL